MAIKQMMYPGGALQGAPSAPGAVGPTPSMGGYPFITPLTVSDIERLAKAGVTVQWDDIKDHVRPDSDSKALNQYTDPLLTTAIVIRWRLANPDNRYGEEPRPPYDFACTKYRDKVYVFASYHGGDLLRQGGRTRTEPCIIIDDAAVFPSDALMAKLIFMAKQDTKGD